jgi:hypothetical protein
MNRLEDAVPPLAQRGTAPLRLSACRDKGVEGRHGQGVSALVQESHGFVLCCAVLWCAVGS